MGRNRDSSTARPRLKTLSRAWAARPRASGGEHDRDVAAGGAQGVELEDVVDRPAAGGDRAPVGGREPVGPGVGQAGAPALAHPLDQGLGQLLVPGAAQQAHLPLEGVQRRLREGPVDLDDQAHDHVGALAEGDVGVDPDAVELGHAGSARCAGAGPSSTAPGGRTGGRRRCGRPARRAGGPARRCAARPRPARRRPGAGWPRRPRTAPPWAGPGRATRAWPRRGCPRPRPPARGCGGA